MAYVAFQDAKPVASDNGNQVVNDIRTNLEAMRDAVVMGMMPGWNYAPSGGTPSEPATVLYSKGSERLRGALTWGSSGGADGNVTQIVWSYSADGGSNYDPITTEAITYDSDAFVTSITRT